MDSTTLVAFHFKAPPSVRMVELLGSWDNFSRPYRMQTDPRKGAGHWTGCHSFRNIVCDGDRWSSPRNGALKQGGLYWYYYKLDDREECCDSTQPATPACPLLPGQMVNILEIPTEVMPAPKRVCSASADAPSNMPPLMTRNPEDRYKKVHRKPPTKLPRLYSSTDALREKAGSRVASLCGGAVQVSSKAEEGELRPLSSMHPFRGREESGSEAGASTTDPNSLAAVAKEVGQLQPFAPTFQSPTNARPLTRTGDDSNSPFGLGITLFGSTFPAASVTQEYDATDEPKECHDESHGSSLQCPMAPRPPSIEDFGDSCFQPQPLPSATLPMREPNWRFSHPNPLRGNPTPPLHVHVPAFPPFHSAGGFASYDRLNPVTMEKSSISPPSHLEIGVNHAGSDTTTVAGYYDMLSPTFTAETLDSPRGGPQTPDRLRLSGQYYDSRDFSSLNQEDDQDRQSELRDLAKRMSGLTPSEIDEDDSTESSERYRCLFPEQKMAHTDPNSSSITLKPFPTPQTQQMTAFEYLALEQADARRLALLTSCSNASEDEMPGGDFASSVLGALGMAL
ncbi:hypothetical protein MBLNU459_g7518t1 [Dothideomycetes sp. NU459]